MDQNKSSCHDGHDQYISHDIKTEKNEMPANKAETLERGITLAIHDIKIRLQKKEKIIVHVNGKTGAGKSTFSNRLNEVLKAEGITATVVSTDDFYIDPANDIETRQYDLSEISEVVAQKQSEAAVVIAEGLVAHDLMEPDYNIFVERDFGQRMARRLKRDHDRGHESVADALARVVKTSIYNPEAILKFEADQIFTKMDLLVYNDKRELGNPELFMTAGYLVFEVNGQEMARAPLDAEGKATRLLEAIGIPTK